MLPGSALDRVTRTAVRGAPWVSSIEFMAPICASKELLVPRTRSSREGGYSPPALLVAESPVPAPLEGAVSAHAWSIGMLGCKG